MLRIPSYECSGSLIRNAHECTLHLRASVVLVLVVLVVLTILLAAGTGSRMAGAVDDTVLTRLAGRPVFAPAAAAYPQPHPLSLRVNILQPQTHSARP